MKIGILTYHRTLNYGGCLQALSMRLLLEQLGHEAYFVDYWPKYHKDEYAIFNKIKYNKLSWKGKIKYLLQFFLRIKNIKQRQKHFLAFMEEYIFPYCKSIDEQFDVIVYGSDQIWRKQVAMQDYDPIYFGVNSFNAKKHISFSASMGIIPDKEEDIIKIKSLLSHLDAIAVRENNLRDFAHSLGYYDTVVTLDPTLLLDASIWERIADALAISSKEYILIYSLWGDAFDMKSIRFIAKEENLSIIVLKGEAGIIDSPAHITTAGPNTFISLIKNAKYVFSSSFHGLVFSLIFHKEVFASFITNGERAKSLLFSLGLEERYLEPKVSFSSEFEPIDYSQISNRLVLLKEQSIGYLKKNLV